MPGIFSGKAVGGEQANLDTEAIRARRARKHPRRGDHWL